MGNRSAKCLTIVVGMALLALLLGGCGPEPPAPTPTPNPHAHETATILVSVSDVQVDDVKVVSTWQLGNFGCAPIIYPEGYMKNQPVFVNEKVVKVGNNYDAKILLDRFNHNKCNWFLAVIGIDFMHKGKVYASYGLRPSETSTQDIVCMILPSSVGICELADSLNSTEQQIKRKFNATVEISP
jgi:hypothetical protein